MPACFRWFDNSGLLSAGEPGEVGEAEEKKFD
jgi:hypothetical protein